MEFDDLLADCVHCGFCLPTCPTYVLWGEEMDSPRGRINLMQQERQGAALDDTMVRHFDQCLGCMACVSACPSGVQYDRLIEATRATVEARHRRPLRERVLRALVFQTFPYPRRLRALRSLLRAYEASGARRVVRRFQLPATVETMERLLPPLGDVPAVAEITPAIGTQRARVGMLLGCVQREFFAGVNASTVRVLAAEGCQVVAPSVQECCGALSLHIGREAEAMRFAKRLIETFEQCNVDAIIVNAAGCGSSMKDYGWLLRHDADWSGRAAAFAAKVRDVSEFLVELGPVAPRQPLPMIVAYHDACHLAHAQRIRTQPRALLTGIPGLVLREIAEGDICCGSAGVYNLLQPEPARALGERKAGNVVRTGADVLVTANPGCLMQIGSALDRAGSPMRTAHPIELLDASVNPDKHSI